VTKERKSIVCTQNATDTLCDALIVVIILIAVFHFVTHYSVDKCLLQQRLKALSLRRTYTRKCSKNRHLHAIIHVKHCFRIKCGLQQHQVFSIRYLAGCQ